MPERIQLRRTKGWRKHPDAIVVARPSVFGNPFTVAQCQEWLGPMSVGDARRYCVDGFRRWIAGSDEEWPVPESERTRRRMVEALPRLIGHDVACWCRPTDPCHGDVLLVLAEDLALIRASPPQAATDGMGDL